MLERAGNMREAREGSWGETRAGQVKVREETGLEPIAGGERSTEEQPRLRRVTRGRD